MQLQVLLNHDYPAYSYLAVVREFQSRAGLLVTGVVDTVTDRHGVQSVM